MDHWKVAESYFGGIVIRSCVNNKVIAVTHCHRPDAENAFLIAMAPELLEHIREAVDNCRICNRPGQIAFKKCSLCERFLADIMLIERGRNAF